MRRLIRSGQWESLIEKVGNSKQNAFVNLSKILTVCGAECSRGELLVTKAAQFDIRAGKCMCMCVCTCVYACAFTCACSCRMEHNSWPAWWFVHVCVKVVWVRVVLYEFVDIPSCWPYKPINYLRRHPIFRIEGPCIIWYFHTQRGERVCCLLRGTYRKEFSHRRKGRSCREPECWWHLRDE